MENLPSQAPPPPEYVPPAPSPKKGLGTGAMIGIGCGGLVVLIIIGIIIVSVIFGPKIAKIGEDIGKNPTRGTASIMVMAGGEMVAEDDVIKRYTVKDKKSGTLTTIYWDEKTKSPKVISGDFSAIPTDAPVVPAPGDPTRE